jgi:class 3 adenylate cyclase/tetratricopeptide (TPR) repeat protein
MERKLATVLFVDLVDSTSLLAGTDPEVARRRVTQFFERVSHCIHTHGGTVEKFAGDAVMAAFGIPQAHEDDAERAIRAGLSIREAVGELGLQARIGVEAGEVVVEDSDSTFATGEAVNLAARLEQAAPPGEILVGPSAQRLAFPAIEFEPADGIAVRGAAEDFAVWRAVGAGDGARPRPFAEAPLVGREAELELLQNTFERVARDRRAHLFTIFGEPGIGKSRLAREFCAVVEGATVLSGRALPYGEGITYWPLAEMVKASAGITDDDPVEAAHEKLVECCEDEAVADLLGLASGLLHAVETGERTQQEIAWAAREWAEQMASVQPLVLVFEDVHWAEEPLLELLEYIASHAREAPILLLCLARPELLDVHPSWGGGRLRATSIELEPLPSEESEELVEALLTDGAVSAPVRESLLEKAEGNPLFVEETIRMLLEFGGDCPVDRIPDTVQTLIAARIDRLPPDERTVLRRAAVIGRVFWAGALSRLSTDVESVDELLEHLAARDFIQPQPRSTISGERAFRFKHGLIREVAYAGLAKAARAEQHAAFAAWLQQRAGEELLEIRAYHLDHACALLAELEGAAPADLAAEAAEALEAAGRRALAREAYRTARKLLLRASELGPTLERRWLAARAASRLGDYPAVASEMEAVRVAAAKADEQKIHGRALTALAEVALYRGADVPRAHELVDEALDVLADVKHAETRFEAFRIRAAIAYWLGEFGDVEHYYAKALDVAREAERKDLETAMVESLAALYVTQLKVAKAEPLVERALELAEASGSILARAGAVKTLGTFHRVKDELDEAESAFEQSRALYAEIGNVSGAGWNLNQLGRIAQVRGDAALAEKRFREAIRMFKSLDDRAFLCESQRMLAQLLTEQGRLDEAERLALEARETVGPQDAVSQVTTRLALGVVRAAQGRDEEAEELLRGAVHTLSSTPFRFAEPETLRALIQFLRERGRDDEAAEFEARLAKVPLVAPDSRAARIA